MTEKSSNLVKILIDCGLFVSMYLISILANLPLTLITLHSPNSLLDYLVLLLAILLLVVALVLGYWFYNQKYHWPAFDRHSLLCLVAGTVSVLLVNFTLSALNRLITHAIPPNNLVLKAFTHGATGWVLLVTVVLIAPASEELLYRGVIQTWLGQVIKGSDKKKRGWSILLSSTAFAYAHLTASFTGFLIYFAMGLVLGVNFDRHHDLRINFGIHSLNNLIALLL